MPGESARQAYGPSAPALARAHSRRDRLERGETIDQIARRDGTSRGAVFRDLRLAREGADHPQPVAPKRRLGERAMLFRAWTVTRNLDVFRLVGLSMSMLWLSVVMQIHLNSDGDLYFGPRCRSLEELARGAGGTEVDLRELIARDLLLWLEEGGVALPEDLGLRLPERVGGRTVGGSGATPPQRRAGRGPDGRQGEILMGMPSGMINVESAKPESGVESGDSQTRQNGPEIPAVVLSQTHISALAGGEGTTTTTKDSESSGGGGGESVAAREDARRDPESANAESARPESAKSEYADPESAEVDSMAGELLALVGRSGTPRPKEDALVRAWLALKTPNEVREAIGTRMEQRNAPKAPDLSFFDQRVREWAPRTSPLPPLPPAPEPPENPTDTVAYLRDDPDNPVLLQAWIPMRATLRAGISEAEYRSWIRNMKLGGLDGDEVVMLLGTSLAADWVRDHYGPRITLLWKQAYPEARRVDFRVTGA